MEKFLSLFRIFDIAFFIPGSAIYLSMLNAGFGLGFDPKLSLTTGGGFLGVLLATTAVYGLGLLVHATQITVSRWRRFPFFRRGQENDARPSWYCRLQGSRREELATYFWYLRATCWNLAVAISGSLMVLIGSGELRGKRLVVTAITVTGAVLLLDRLGRDYDRALQRATGRGGRRQDSG